MLARTSVPVAAAVAIVGKIIKLITYAIDDEGRWRRLMDLLAPLLVLIVTLILTLTAIAAWWLLADGGIEVLLHDFRPDMTTPSRDPSPGRAVQLCRLPGQRLVKLPLAGALEDPGNLGEQVGPASGELAQLPHRGRVFRPGQVASPGAVPRFPRQLG